MARPIRRKPVESSPVDPLESVVDDSPIEIPDWVKTDAERNGVDSAIEDYLDFRRMRRSSAARARRTDHWTHKPTLRNAKGDIIREDH